MSAEHTPRFEEMLPAYVLGALEGDELRELEAHLATGCEDCRRQLRIWESDLEEIAASVPPLAPSAETRQRVLAAAAPPALPQTARLEPRPRRSPPSRQWGWLAATVLFAVLHTGPGRAFRVWTLFAVVAGGLFGGLMEWRGNLLAPVIGHFVVNGVNLRRLASRAFDSARLPRSEEEG